MFSYRIDPVLSSPIGLDDASELSQLAELAKQVDLEATYDWLTKCWKTDPNPEVHETASIPLDEANGKPVNNNWRCIVQ